MGAERESGARAPHAAADTHPGVGAGSGHGAAVPDAGQGGTDAESAADVVDFDALHAALGDLPPPPTSSAPSVGESQGASSATYSSARPHTIPPTRAPADDPHAPAVIVQQNDTVPSGASSKMTVPMSGAPPFGARAHPPSPGTPQSPSRPFTPQAFAPPFAGEGAAQAVDVNATVQMPARPPRPRTPTMVVRSRGPSGQQKLLVFLVMLAVFVGAGVALLFYGKSLGLDVDVLPTSAKRRPVATAPTAPLPAATPAPTPSVTSTGLPSASSVPSAPAAKPSAAPRATAAPPAKPTKAAPSKKQQRRL